MLPLVPGNGLKNWQRDVVIRYHINPASYAWQRTQKWTKSYSYKMYYNIYVLENLPLVPCIRLLKNEEEMYICDVLETCLLCLAFDSKKEEDMQICDVMS